MCSFYILASFYQYQTTQTHNEKGNSERHWRQKIEGGHSIELRKKLNREKKCVHCQITDKNDISLFLFSLFVECHYSSDDHDAKWFSRHHCPFAFDCYILFGHSNGFDFLFFKMKNTIYSLTD